MSQSIKRNDEVVVIAGSHKGKRGKILQVLPTRDRLIVEGVALQKRVKRKTQEDQEGGFVEKEASLHRSNVMLASRYDAKQSSKNG